MEKTTDYLTGKIGCTVKSPYSHIAVVGTIVDEAVYNFLVDTGNGKCLCNKIGVWQISCNRPKQKNGDRKSLYKHVPIGKHVTVYLINARLSGTVKHVDNFLIVIESDGDEYVIHKDLIVAICWQER